jgi:uracil-DNA glycosylase
MRTTERKENAAAVQDLWSQCTKCELCENRGPIQKSDWRRTDDEHLSTSVMFVVDRTDKEVLHTGEVPTGDLKEYVLDVILEMQPEPKYTEQYWVTPITLCPTTVHEEDRWPPLELMPIAKEAAFRECRPRLHAEIRAINPEVIVAMGSMALKALYPKSPPKYGPNLGLMQDLRIPSDNQFTDRIYSVMPTLSLAELHRNRDYSSSGPWALMDRHLQVVFQTADYMRGLRSNND